MNTARKNTLNDLENILDCKIEISYAEFLLGLNYVLEKMPDRETRFIKKRYIEKKTLETIGKEEDITRERARQIIARGMRKVKYWNSKYHILDKGIYWYVNNEIEKVKQEEEQKYKTIIDNYEAIIKKYNETNNVEVLKNTDVLTWEIEGLDFTCRTYNCLKRASINTVYELSKTSKGQLRHIRNLGTKSLKEIINKLKEYDIELKNEITEVEQEDE